MCIYIFFLAPPEIDENGAPRIFRKDELLQFLRVCFKKFN
jgi:hypothetical protein